MPIDNREQSISVVSMWKKSQEFVGLTIAHKGNSDGTWLIVFLMKWGT